MDDGWIPMKHLRPGDLVVEGRSIILVLEVTRLARDTWRVAALRDGGVDDASPFIGSFAFGRVVARREPATPGSTQDKSK